MESKFDEKLFAGEEPFTIFRRWLEEARETEINDPDAIALATVDKEGLPNVRMVLLRIIGMMLLFFSLTTVRKKREKRF